MILASSSHRRLAILRQAGLEPEVRPQDIDETPLSGESPESLVERLARTKALSAAADAAGRTVIAADTIVWMDGELLGKPADAADAVRMLSELSGRSHHVSTGVCAIAQAGTAGQKLRSFVETTEVRFFELTPAQIEAYVDTGEPMDKAGAYGYQAKGCTLVESIAGDYYNVVGLPIGRLLRILADMGAL